MRSGCMEEWVASEGESSASESDESTHLRVRFPTFYSRCQHASSSQPKGELQWTTVNAMDTTVNETSVMISAMRIGETGTATRTGNSACAIDTAVRTTGTPIVAAMNT